MRWVDDRWTTIVGCCPRAVTEGSRWEYIKYTCLAYEKKQVLVQLLPLANDGDGDELKWQETTSKVLSYLGKFMEQTREEVQEVVGMDVGIQHGHGEPIQAIPAWGKVGKATVTTTFVTRPNTKDKDLARGERHCPAQCTHPRIHPRALCDGSSETRRVLAATMIRFADMASPTWAQNFPRNCSNGGAPHGRPSVKSCC